MNRQQNRKETVAVQKTEERQELRRLYAETVPYLLQWYDYNRRLLPWREEPTPYHVWVSEIMLQQTRVEAVRGYYDRFLTHLPDIAALAAAGEEELLKLWEGLGYYNRVRNMQRAAEIIMREYGGRMPENYESLRALPGIGDYTAGAIASIAFGLPYPAVDGNVLRVMSRIACSEADITKEQTKQKLKEELTFVIPERSGDFNQSLMELGATVCLPNGKPLCDRCPVMHLCRAFHAERETELPVKSGKKERRVEQRRVYLVFCNGMVLLHRREKKGLLAGLWEFPNLLLDGEKRGRTAAEIIKELPELGNALEQFDVSVKKAKRAKHIFSHVEWHMEGVRLEVQTSGTNKTNQLSEIAWRLSGNGKGSAERKEMTGDGDGEWIFVTVEELQEKYPVPSAFEVYRKEIGNENEAVFGTRDEEQEA